MIENKKFVEGKTYEEVTDQLFKAVPSHIWSLLPEYKKLEADHLHDLIELYALICGLPLKTKSDCEVMLKRIADDRGVSIEVTELQLKMQAAEIVQRELFSNQLRALLRQSQNVVRSTAR